MKFRNLLHWYENPLLPMVVMVGFGKVFQDQFNIGFWLVICLGAGISILGWGFQSASMALKIPIFIERIRQVLVWMAFFVMGLLMAQFHDKPSGTPVHEAFLARIKEPLGKTANGKIRCLALVEAAKSENSWQKSGGKVLLFLDGEEEDFENGTRLLINQSLKELESPSIPGQFDGKAYYGRQGIRYQNFVSESGSLILKDTKPDWLLGTALKVRKWFENQLLISLPAKEDAALLSGLLLGLKRQIDPDLKVAFSASGLSHVLAVSGLHVGLIYTFLVWVLGWLRSSKRGSILFSVLIVLALWFYALITGLSPSVLRAVTIFSILQMGDLFLKPKWPVNNLCLATLILFCFNPDIIYDVGFQLSFSAVYGIIAFQRPLAEWLPIRNKKLVYLWNSMAMTLAATLGTFPIVLYYFHQFPVYFLVANLLAVPLATGIIYGGIGMLAAAPFPALAKVIGCLLHYVIAFFIWLVKGISWLPYSTISSIFFPFWFLGLLFLALYFFQLWLKTGLQSRLHWSLGALNFFLGAFLVYNLYLWNRPGQRIIIRTGKEWMLAHVEGRSAKLCLLANNSEKTEQSFEAKALREGLHVLQVNTSSNQGLDLNSEGLMERGNQLPKSTNRKSILVREGGLDFLFLGSYLKIKPRLANPLDIDFLVVNSVGIKSLEKALTIFRPREIWVDWNPEMEAEWNGNSKFSEIPIRNFRKDRFVYLN